MDVIVNASKLLQENKVFKVGNFADVQKSQLLKQFSIPICAGNSSKVDDEVFELVNKCKEVRNSVLELGYHRS